MALSFHIITTRKWAFVSEPNNYYRIVSEEHYDSLMDGLDPNNSDSLNDPDDEVYDWVREYFDIALGRKVACGGYALEVIRENEECPQEPLGSRLNVTGVNVRIKRDVMLLEQCLWNIRDGVIFAINHPITQEFVRWANATALTGEVTMHILLDEMDDTYLYSSFSEDTLNILTVDGRAPKTEYEKRRFELNPLFLAQTDISTIYPEDERMQWEIYETHIRHDGILTNKYPYIVGLKKLPDGSFSECYHTLPSYPEADERLDEFREFLGTDSSGCEAAALILDMYKAHGDKLYDSWEYANAVHEGYYCSGGDIVKLEPREARRRFHELFAQYGKPLSVEKKEY